MEKRRRIRGPIILSGEALEPQQKAAGYPKLRSRREGTLLTCSLSIESGVRKMRMMRGVVRNVRQIVSGSPFGLGEVQAAVQLKPRGKI